MRKSSTAILLVSTGLLVAALWPRATVFAKSYEGVMGTSLDLKIAATSARAAELSESAALTEIDRESRILSGYDASSEFRRWTATLNEPVAVSAELFDVLQRFDVWRERTGGAIDASAETVSRVWKAAETAGHLPGHSDLAAAVSAARHSHWRLDAATRTATHLDAAPLILNSFTKSYIIDRAAAHALAVPGVVGVVVNAGGDVITRGDWSETIDITDPRASADNSRPLVSLSVRDSAVATSGDYRRGFNIEGVHYSHIVDPRTGEPTRQVIAATVVAPAGADAGALATAFCVLTPDESEQLAESIPNIEFLMVLADGRQIESGGWAALRQSTATSRAWPAAITTLHAAEQAAWKSDYELTIALEIAQPAFRAQRPYVAVWIEDKDHNPVRTIAVWYSERQSRYLPELRAWYRGDRQRTMNDPTDVLRSVSSATRGPGQYSLVWDGKDNAGKPVKAGTYTVLIEASREHGTYQIMRQDMDFSGTAKKIELPGNTEIAAATLDYHRVGK
jgi:thiamine biosynthesis lipoprotein ApbE